MPRRRRLRRKPGPIETPRRRFVDWLTWAYPEYTVVDESRLRVAPLDDEGPSTVDLPAATWDAVYPGYLTAYGGRPDEEAAFILLSVHIDEALYAGAPLRARHVTLSPGGGGFDRIGDPADPDV